MLRKIKNTALVFIFASFTTLVLFASPLLAKEKEKLDEKGVLPIKDTYVNSAYPDTNYGQDPRLITSYTNSSRIIFMQFDLEPVTFVNPDQKTYLQMNLESSNTSLEPVEMEILLPSKEWSEIELCWNNKPSLYSSELTASFEATPGAQKVDITPLVKEWINGEKDNFGIAFYYNGKNFLRKFSSKEAEENKPQLIMEGMPENLLQEIRIKGATASSKAKSKPKKTSVKKEKSPADILGISEFVMPEINLQFVYKKELWAMGLWVLGLGFLLSGWWIGTSRRNGK